MTNQKLLTEREQGTGSIDHTLTMNDLPVQSIQ
jgi:hypothetical protein